MLGAGSAQVTVSAQAVVHRWTRRGYTRPPGRSISGGSTIGVGCVCGCAITGVVAQGRQARRGSVDVRRDCARERWHSGFGEVETSRGASSGGLVWSSGWEWTLRFRLRTMMVRLRCLWEGRVGRPRDDRAHRFESCKNRCLRQHRSRTKRMTVQLRGVSANLRRNPEDPTSGRHSDPGCGLGLPVSKRHLAPWVFAIRSPPTRAACRGSHICDVRGVVQEECVSRFPRGRSCVGCLVCPSRYHFVGPFHSARSRCC